MKKICLLIFVFAISLASYSQDYSLRLGQTKVQGLTFDPVKDTVKVFDGNAKEINIFGFSKEDEMYYIETQNQSTDFLGKYKVIVFAKQSNSQKHEYSIDYITPIPEINKIKVDGINELAKQNGIYIFDWDNTKDEFELTISGKNFYFLKGQESNPTYSYINWIEDDPNIAITFLEVKDNNNLKIKINLSKVKRTGTFNFQLQNFDKSLSQLFEIKIQPHFPVSITTPASPQKLEIGQINSLVLDCKFPIQIEKFYMNTPSAGNVTHKITEDNKLRLNIFYSSRLEDIYYKLWHSTEMFELNANVRLNNSNRISFGEISRYDVETIKATEEFQLSSTPSINQSNITFYNTEDSSKFLKFNYIVKNRDQSNESHYLALVNDTKLNSTYNGEYYAKINDWDFVGLVKIKDIPKIEFVEWRKEGDVDNLYFNKIYATGEEQTYNLKIKFERDYKPENGIFEVFGIPLTNANGEGSTYTFEVKLPPTMKKGDFPKIKYLKNYDVVIKSEQDQISVKSFNKPIRRKGFVSIKPSANENISYDLFENVTGIEPVIRKDNNTKLEVTINNKAEFHAGKQYIKISFKLKNDYGELKKTKIGIKDSFSLVVREYAVEVDSIITEIIDFNTFSIDKWDYVEVELTFKKDNYEIVTEREIEPLEMTFLYRNKSNTKWVLGTGLPMTSSIVMYDIKNEDWIFSPFNLGLSIGQDKVNEYGTWLGWGYGLQIGFSQLDKLVDDESEYFGLSFIPYFNFDIPRLLNQRDNIKLPVAIGVGCVSSWEHGVNYWNPTVMFEIKLNITGNHNQEKE